MSKWHPILEHKANVAEYYLHCFTQPVVAEVQHLTRGAISEHSLVQN